MFVFQDLLVGEMQNGKVPNARPHVLLIFLFLKRVEWNRWSGGVHAVLLETGTEKKGKTKGKRC